jgi:ATP-dependent DNA helicase RecG
MPPRPPPPTRRPSTNSTASAPPAAAALAKLGVKTAADLLEYFPHRYQLEVAERPIAELSEDAIQNVRGEVIAVDYIAAYPRPRFEATVQDETGRMACVWFNAAYLRTRIHPGQTLLLKGKVRQFRNVWQMTNPKWAPADDDTPASTESRFKPVYFATAKMPSDAIARVVQDHLDRLLLRVHEWFEAIGLRRGN